MCSYFMSSDLSFKEQLWSTEENSRESNEWRLISGISDAALLEVRNIWIAFRVLYLLVFFHKNAPFSSQSDK